ncbi:Per1-domain-containing protein [Backusella circina FSU 941]|nr:Per1-domain-containing protein [Backusella circina FSU 941]
MNNTNTKSIKVAVIGSGLAGLTAAYLLSNKSKEVEVHLFERNKSVGMDASSISAGSNHKQRIDVSYYNHLFKLYQHLNIPIMKAKFSFGWYRIQAHTSLSHISPEDLLSYTEHNSYLVYSGSTSVGRLSTATDANTSGFFWRAVVVIYSYLWLMALSLWMYHRGHLSNPNHSIHRLTLGDFFDKYHIHSYFVHQVFVPLFAAVCTNSHQSMHQYPAADILEYMAVGLFQESYVVSCGVRRVVELLSKPLKHIHLETQITNIKPSHDGINRFLLEDSQGHTYKVNHIIFATQGNQAYCMLKNYYQNILDQPTWNNEALLRQVQDQIEMLHHFKYDKALVINHTDVRLLPNDKNNWKSLNFAMVNDNIDPGSHEWIVPFPHNTTMTTHILNMTHQGLDDGQIYLQTTNPCVAIDPKKALSVAWFERATVTLMSKRQLEEHLFTPRSVQEQERDGTSEPKLGKCQGKNNIWFVGSYCWKGIPLLEGCVASAELVVTEGIAKVEELAIKSPWFFVKCLASSGDELTEYQDCVDICAENTEHQLLPLHLKLLRWTVKENCGYHCMQSLTHRAMETGDHIHQFYGKWPFQRVFGIQEPASVVFSMLNGLMHFRYRKIIKDAIPNSYYLKHFYLGMTFIGMNAWVWSSVFHTRDTPLTEKLDYFSAGLYILYGLCVAVLRIGHLAGWAAKGWAGMCFGLFTAHVLYLSSLDRFDYTYNIIACLVVGLLQNILWLSWSLYQYSPFGDTEKRSYAWMAGLSVVLISCAMAFELFDFPPLFETLDAHSAWHAATIPLSPLFYRFLLRDSYYEASDISTAAKKRSS